MGYEAIVAAAAGIIGALFSAGKEEEAQRLREQMAAEYGDNILPDLDKAVAQSAGQSAFQSNAEDSTGRRAQLDALGELNDVYETGGRTAADEAAYTQAGRKVSQRAAQRQGEAQLAAAGRGQAGGPMAGTLASSAGQDELEALASLDADVASSGRDRALQALGMKANLSTGLRGDDWRALEAKLSATDLMNRFNTSNAQQAEMYNVGLPQQQFDNRMGLLTARNAARAGQAAGLDASAAAGRQTAAGVGNAALSYGQAWDWGQKKKKGDE